MDDKNFPDIFEEPKDEPQPKIPLPKKLERSRSNIIVAGLCSGIAKYINSDPAVVRLLVMLSLLFGYWSVAAYVVAVFLIPAERTPDILTREEKIFQKKINFRTVLSGLTMLFGFYLGFVSIGLFSSDRIFILPNSFMFPFISIFIGVYYLFIVEEKAEETSRVCPDKFLRSHKDRLFLGVCGGLSNYLNLESTTVRIIYVLASVLTLGIFAVSYLIIAVLSETEKPDIEEQ
jgi:phage shock protein C